MHEFLAALFLEGWYQTTELVDSFYTRAEFLTAMRAIIVYIEEHPKCLADS